MTRDIAAGLIDEGVPTKTVQALTVFKRCKRAFPPFDDKIAATIARDRNTEIHSGAAAFTSRDELSWWERYWSQATLLLPAIGIELTDLVDFSASNIIEEDLNRNAENIARRLEAKTAAARNLYAATSQSEDKRRELDRTLRRNAQTLLEHSSAEWGDPITCPACQNLGHLYGESIVDVEDLSDHDGPWERASVFAEDFLCPECGLRLTGEAELNAMNLPDTFDIQYEPEWEPDDYGND